MLEDFPLPCYGGVVQIIPYSSSRHILLSVDFGIFYHGILSCRVESIGGNAMTGTDFIGVNEIVEFKPNEFEKQVELFLCSGDVMLNV